jgi:hypothetical protein
MATELFSPDEGRALLDIVRGYLLHIPGDLDGAQRHVLGVLVDEAQAAMIVEPVALPDGVTPLRR